MTDIKSYFNSTELQLAIEKTQSDLSNIKSLLDNISSDIKNLEIYLSNVNLPCNHTYHLPNIYVTEDKKMANYLNENQISFFLEENLINRFNCQTEIIKQYIIWNQKDKSLLYKKESAIAFCEYINSYESTFLRSEFNVTDERRLIETPIDIRRNAYKHLPEFIYSLRSSYEDLYQKPLFELDDDELPDF